MNSSKLNQLLPFLAELLIARQWMMGTAESCTGGWIAKACTDLSGSSAWFTGAVVSYSNNVKMNLLNVPEQQLIDFGAVSEPVVISMVEGAAKALEAQVAVSVSGIAGPGGGSKEKPVGTVWIGFNVPGLAPYAKRYQFDGDREQVRVQTVETVIEELLEILKKNTVFG